MDGAKRNPRRQGDRGEGLAALWFYVQGADVLGPMFHTHPDFDFVVGWGEGAKRIQVKTSTVFRKGR